MKIGQERFESGAMRAYPAGSATRSHWGRMTRPILTCSWQFTRSISQCSGRRKLSGVRDERSSSRNHRRAPHAAESASASNISLRPAKRSPGDRRSHSSHSRLRSARTALPGASEDFDHAECIVLVGHNAAEQSTVLWMRILAAKAGPLRSKVIVVDPRRTLTVSIGADLHLQLKPGTNVALLNGELIWISSWSSPPA